MTNKLCKLKIIVPILTCAMIFGLGGSAPLQSASGVESLPADVISQTEAERIALAKGEGKVVKVELDGEVLESEIYIIKDDLRHEIKVDGVTGQILKSEKDDDRYGWNLPANVISQTEAERIALTSVNGQVVKVELDGEDLEYEVYIILDGIKHEIKIDAVTGQILKTEIDDDRYGRNLPANVISQAEAERIALTSVNGQVVKVELDGEDLEYEVYIILDGIKHEIKIDAVTGQILKTEIDDDRSDSRGKGDDYHDSDDHCDDD